MTKDVLIHIGGLQFAPGAGEQDALETITPGEYYYRNGSHFLLFEECVEGFEKSIQNMVKFKNGYLELRKKGLIQVQMIFEEGKKNVTLYQTPFGEFEMGISTTRLSMNEKENRMEIYIGYALEVSGSFLADCEIRIEVQAR